MDPPDHYPPAGDYPHFSHDKGAAFSTTHWSVVVTAGHDDLAGATLALDQLCSKYWYPIYAFIRRRGSDYEEAEDLTQGFFAHLIEMDTLKKADRQKGKFRTFLLASLTKFLSNERDKQHTAKRGGGRQVLSLDQPAAEGLYSLEPAVPASPEKLFDRHWAAALVDGVLARLREEYRAGGKAELLAQLEPSLTQEPGPGGYAHWAGALGLSQGAVRVALHRMRRRFGQLLREEIAQTVAHPADVDEEIRHLFASFTA
ncbi:MAG TPA: sigma-70 family RNA polymerase sigma factor [Verrucomicrobiae bacterium]|nr:sigma-70 family RNA polymerase sigma factor [Verrucomicrobiae bacterium]